VTGAAEYHLEVYDDEGSNLVFQLPARAGDREEAEALAEGALVMDQGETGRELRYADASLDVTITPPDRGTKLTEPAGSVRPLIHRSSGGWVWTAGSLNQIDNNDTFRSGGCQPPAGADLQRPMPDGKFCGGCAPSTARAQPGRRPELYCSR
jgi:hypothetical protein